MLFNCTAECKEIDTRHEGNGGNGDNGKKKTHSGFNVGFELTFWEQWCKLAGETPSKPVQEAAQMMAGDDNFMKKHSKLKNDDKGDVWVFVKADTKQDIEQLYKVLWLGEQSI